MFPKGKRTINEKEIMNFKKSKERYIGWTRGK